MTGGSVNAATTSTTASASVRAPAPITTACVLETRSVSRPCSHDAAAHETPAPVSTAPARLGENS